MKLSVVIPVYNEAAGLSELFGELTAVCVALQHEYEIIAVDDGSRDRSFEAICERAAHDRHLKAIRFRVNAGQTAAIAAGVAHASGDVIVTIDSDLENDPRDISKLLEKLDEGYDVVSGWRTGRWQKERFTRRLPSALANRLISAVTGVRLHDYGCTLKAYRREVIVGVRLYGEMHRFVPAYASWQGARVTETPVSHRPRRFGASHYGASRIFRILLDLVLIGFFDRFMDRPIHFFGGLGFISLGSGFLAGFIAIAFKVVRYKHFVATPLPLLSTLLIIVGVQLIAMGVVAEILMRVYYESQGKTPYLIKEKVNF